MKAREVYRTIDGNSDPGAPLTFWAAERGPRCPPPFEDSPFFIAPGHTYALEVEVERKAANIVFRHDEEGIEITREVLLGILEPFSQDRHALVDFKVFDEAGEDFCYFLDGEGLWSKIECPERNVFFCWGITWSSSLKGGNNNCNAVSLAY